MDETGHNWCSVPGGTANGRKKANLGQLPWMKDVSIHPYPGAKRKPKLRRLWLQQMFRDETYEPKRYHISSSRDIL